jgi:hypothetical protein
MRTGNLVPAPSTGTWYLVSKKALLAVPGRLRSNLLLYWYQVPKKHGYCSRLRNNLLPVPGTQKARVQQQITAAAVLVPGSLKSRLQINLLLYWYHTTINPSSTGYGLQVLLVRETYLALWLLYKKQQSTRRKDTEF